MDKKETYTASDALLKELKAKLHRIPEQHLVDRTSSPVVATKPNYMRIVRWSLTAAAAIALAVLFWPNTSTNESDLTEELLAEMYSLGYVQVEDMVDISSYLPDGWGASPMRRRAATASTFAASLELAKAGKVELRQSETFAPLELRRKAQENE